MGVPKIPEELFCQRILSVVGPATLINPFLALLAPELFQPVWAVETKGKMNKAKKDIMLAFIIKTDNLGCEFKVNFKKQCKTNQI